MITYPHAAMQSLTRHKKSNNNNNYNSYSEQKDSNHKHNHSCNEIDGTGIVVAFSLIVATLLVFVIYCYDRYVKFKNIRKQL